MLFFSCVVIKVGVLAETPEVESILPPRLEQLFHIPVAPLTVVIFSSVVVSLLVSLAVTLNQVKENRLRQLRDARAAVARRLRWRADDCEVFLPPPVIPAPTPPDFEPTYIMGDVSGRFHIFLSHVWGTGQDQMRIIKQRLKEMMPDIAVFLDVDDLAEGKGAEYVDVSCVSLIFVSDGYFQSPNCMRELLRAVVTGKPIVALLEPEAKKGAMTVEEVREQLQVADEPFTRDGVEYTSKYDMWGLALEVKSWGYIMPTAAQLVAKLFDQESIEWNRIGAFQDVTMRLIADSILRESQVVGANDLGSRTYLQDEMSRDRPALPSPRDGFIFHAYCSRHNAGATLLLREVAETQTMEIKVSEDFNQLAKCERMICYLTSKTWTSGEVSKAFAWEVQQAMGAGVSLLLVHEMPGVGGQAARHACEFGTFFACDDGATPAKLLRGGIYDRIATPLKGGEWRKTSMVMVALGLTDDPGAPVEEGTLPGVRREPTRRELTRGATMQRAGSRASRMPTRSPSHRIFGSNISSHNLTNDLEVPPELTADAQVESNSVDRTEQSVARGLAPPSGATPEALASLDA